MFFCPNKTGKMNRQIGFGYYAPDLARNAAGTASVLPYGTVAPQVPTATNSLVRASGWLETAPPYSMDMIPGIGAAPAPGTVNNWSNWGQQQQWQQTATYPPLPVPFGPDSRLLSPGGAVYPTGDYAGTITDPITGIKYAAFTRAMPDPIIPAGGDMAAGPCPGSSQVANRILESLNGTSALTARPCRQDMPRDWSEALAGTQVPAPLLEQQVLAAQGAQAARDTFFVRKDTPAGFNDTHWDGYVGTTNVLRVLQDTQTVKDYDGGGTSRLPFRPNPDFSLAAPMYHDGTEIGGPRAPIVTILAEDKPAPPGRPVPDRLEEFRGQTRMDTASDDLHSARVDVTTRPGNQTPYFSGYGWTTLGSLAPETPDGPAKDEGLGVLPALVSLDPKWTGNQNMLPADDGRGGKYPLPHSIRVAGPQTSVTTSNTDFVLDGTGRWETGPTAARVGAGVIPAGAGAANAAALPVFVDSSRGAQDVTHTMPAFRGGSTRDDGPGQAPTPALATDGRAAFMNEYTAQQGITPQGYLLPSAMAAPVSDAARAGRVFADAPLQVAGPILPAMASTLSPSSLALDSVGRGVLQAGDTLRPTAMMNQFVQGAASAVAAPAPAQDTLRVGQFVDRAGILPTRQPSWNDWHGMVYGNSPTPAITDASTRNWDGGLGVQTVRGAPAVPLAPGAQPSPAMDTVGQGVAGDGIGRFSQLQGPTQVQGAQLISAVADGTAAQYAFLSPMRVGAANVQVGQLSAPLLPAQEGAGRRIGDGTGLATQPRLQSNAMENLGEGGALSGPGRWDGGTGALRVTAPQQPNGAGLESALSGGPGQWDGGLGTQRAIPVQMGLSSAPSQAPAPALDTGPGAWDGGVGAQRVWGVQTNATGQQGTMELPGPGQWSGGLGAQRAVANHAVLGTQDTPVQDGGRYAGKFMGAGAATNVPRSKTLFWTDGVAAYATMPTVKGKDTGDRTDTTIDTHLQHLTMLREVMLAAHPVTGPDVRVKAQAGPERPGVQTAAAADCIIAQRQATVGGLMNAAIESQACLPKGSMTLVDVGYESDV